MENKILTLLGFAKKSGNLISGENTCEIYVKKKKVKLLIIVEDASENTFDKMEKLSTKYGVKYVIFGKREELSSAIGSHNRTCFGILDNNFKNKILEQLDVVD
jgi:ribosomal protein L7Ae-like RNA K-turn-binding protein